MAKAASADSNSASLEVNKPDNHPTTPKAVVASTSGSKSVRPSDNSQLIAMEPFETVAQGRDIFEKRIVGYLKSSVTKKIGETWPELMQIIDQFMERMQTIYDTEICGRLPACIISATRYHGLELTYNGYQKLPS